MTAVEPRLRPYLTDEEVAEICDPLTQHSAQLRFLRSLGLHPDRKPGGQPLVWRADVERVKRGREHLTANDGVDDAQPDAAALAEYLKQRGSHGAQAQGR